MILFCLRSTRFVFCPIRSRISDFGSEAEPENPILIWCEKPDRIKSGDDWVLRSETDLHEQDYIGERVGVWVGRWVGVWVGR